MKTELIQGGYALRVEVQAGEEIVAEPGAMIAMEGMDMKVGSPGGCMSAFRRSCLGGESAFLNTFTTSSGGWLELATATSGVIVERTLTQGEKIYIKQGSWVAASGDVTMSLKFTGLKGMRAGQSSFLSCTAKEGDVKVWFCAGGKVISHELDGNTVIVDNDNCVGYSSGLDWSVFRPGGTKARFVAGEGHTMKFTGSGTVWVQTNHGMPKPPAN